MHPGSANRRGIGSNACAVGSSAPPCRARCCSHSLSRLGRSPSPRSRAARSPSTARATAMGSACRSGAPTAWRGWGGPTSGSSSTSTRAPRSSRARRSPIGSEWASRGGAPSCTCVRRPGRSGCGSGTRAGSSSARSRRATPGRCRHASATGASTGRTAHWSAAMAGVVRTTT